MEKSVVKFNDIVI